MVLCEIPFTLDADRLLSRLGFAANEDIAAEVRQLVHKAAQLAKPKAVFREAFIEARNNDTVLVGGVSFTSKVLQANLESVDRVFAYVTTCGVELDTLRAECSDTLLLYCLDCIKAEALQAANRYLRSFLLNRYGLEKLSSMHPGSGDAQVWPIEQQQQLFALVGDVDAKVGVTLTESYLMEPNKTTSGILYPTENSFVTCSLCHRENCPNRKAAFDEQLWHTKTGE